MLQTNELMVGDHVRLRKEYINSQDEIITIDALDLYRISQGDYEVEPIVLTADILKKNGFKQTQYDWFWAPLNNVYDINEHPKRYVSITFYRDGRCRDIEVSSEYTFYKLKCVENLYIHELQHALRLCGIAKEVVL